MCFVVFVLLFVCISAESKAGMMAAFVVKVFQDLFVLKTDEKTKREVVLTRSRTSVCRMKEGFSVKELQQEHDRCICTLGNNHL